MRLKVSPMMGWLAGSAISFISSFLSARHEVNPVGTVLYRHHLHEEFQFTGENRVKQQAFCWGKTRSPARQAALFGGRGSRGELASQRRGRHAETGTQAWGAHCQRMQGASRLERRCGERVGCKFRPKRHARRAFRIAKECRQGEGQESAGEGETSVECGETKGSACIANLSGSSATGGGSAGWHTDGAGRRWPVPVSRGLMATGRHKKTLRWRVFVINSR